MQIKLLQNNEIDKTLWDKCVEESQSPLIYGTAEFLDIVCPQWQGLVLHNYEAVFPVTVNKKLGYSYLYQPPFMQQGGLFYKTENHTDDFIKVIQSKFKFAEINLNYSNSGIKSRNNFVLDLNKSYSECVNEYSQNHKRNVIKSKTHHLQIETCRIEELIKLFQLNKAKGQSYYSKSDYNKLEQLSSLPNAFCIGVFDGRNLIGGALFIEYNNRITFLFSGYDYQFKHLNAMFFLVNFLVQQHKLTNTLIDFEGSDNENLARFYKGFGSVNQPYYSYKHNNLPVWLKIFKK